MKNKDVKKGDKLWGYREEDHSRPRGSICKGPEAGVGFPGGSDGKESVCNAGDLGSIPGSGRSPGEENGYLPQYSYLENSMDRGAWRLIVYGITESDMNEQLILSSFFSPLIYHSRFL